MLKFSLSFFLTILTLVSERTKEESQPRSGECVVTRNGEERGDERGGREQKKYQREKKSLRKMSTGVKDGE